MKKKMVTALLAVSMLAGLSAVNVMAADDGGDTITVGFSQVGAESDWRTANTESMKSTFSEENGYELIFDDAQQKQENQVGTQYFRKQKTQESRLSSLTVW